MDAYRNNSLHTGFKIKREKNTAGELIKKLFALVLQVFDFCVYACEYAFFAVADKARRIPVARAHEAYKKHIERWVIVLVIFLAIGVAGGIEGGVISFALGMPIYICISLLVYFKTK